MTWYQPRSASFLEKFIDHFVPQNIFLIKYLWLISSIFGEVYVTEVLVNVLELLKWNLPNGHFSHVSFIVWSYEKWLWFRSLIWLLHPYVFFATDIIRNHPLLDSGMWLICTRLKLNLYMSFFCQNFGSIVIDFAKKWIPP